MLTHIGARISSAREAQGLTQEKLARIARISQSYVSRIEYGDRTGVPLPTLARVTAILGLSLGELIREAEQAASVEEIDTPATMSEMRRAVNSLLEER